jgi:hypothetical protein
MNVRQAEADDGKRSDLLTSQDARSPSAAQGELRTAAGERDPQVGIAVFARELNPDRSK